MKFVRSTCLAAALLLSNMGIAGAFTVYGIPTWQDNGGAHSGTAILDVGDSVSIEFLFDTDGELSASNSLLLFAFGLIFDGGIFEYDQVASYTPTYLLYGAPKAPYLVPASTCVPTCDLYPISPHHLQLDFLSSHIHNATGVSNNSAPGGESLGTYVLRIVAAGDGIGDFDFLFQQSLGAILQTSTGTQPVSFFWAVPEPTTALLFGLGLAGAAFARRRSGGARL